MNKKISIFLILQVVVLVMVTFLYAMFNGSEGESGYEISDYKGFLKIFPDNTATYKQEITYQYSDDFQGQYVSLGSAGNLPEYFDINDESVTYEVYKNGAKIASPTVYMEYLGDGYRAKIYNAVYPGDEVKIIITWPMEHLLHAHQDIAELNWLPISNWDVPLEQVKIEVDAPDSPTSQFHVHTGYFDEKANISQNGNDYSLELDKLPAGKRVELHAYWAQSIFYELPEDQFLTTEGLPQFLDKEGKIEKNTHLAKNLGFVYLPIGAVILIFFDLFYIFILRRKIDLSLRQPNDTRLYEAPGDLSPMLVAAQVYNVEMREVNPANVQTEKLKFDHIVQATILDLVDRGNLKIDEAAKNPTLKYWSSEGLSTAEKQFILMAFGHRKSSTIKGLFKDFEASGQVLKGNSSTKKSEVAEIRRSGDALLDKYHQALEELSQSVEDDLNSMEKVSHFRPLSGGERLALSLAGVPSILATVAPLFYYGYVFLMGWANIWFLANIAVAGAFVAYVIYKIKSDYYRDGVVTEAGVEIYYLWQSFRNMLRDIGRFERTELEAIVLWNRILVYATLFGYATEVSRVLQLQKIHFRNKDLDIFVHYNYHNHLMIRTQGFRSDVSQARSASNFNVPSSSSSGGGFSSGGFSGGGGGGGGGSF